MRDFELSRAALSITLAGALLSACGGGSSVPVVAGNTFSGATGSKHHQTFAYTGTKQTFIVPAGITRLTVIARGGEGAGRFVHGSGTPGFPGRVYAVIRVHSGDKLYVFVAGGASDGGFNGGGAGAGRGGGGGGGGGAADVRVGGDTLKDRIIVAAGGGGFGGCDLYCYASGGDGGGLNGQKGFGFSGISGGGGGGGTQSAGGLGGAGGVGQQSSGDGQPGGNGALGLGGNGGAGGQSTGTGYAGIAGGGGGGGYYGGGGGGGSASIPGSSLDIGGGGGGGGSSYVEPSAITSRMWTGWVATGKGDGQVIFSWK
jgi:hypothetical protein